MYGTRAPACDRTRLEVSLSGLPSRWVVGFVLSSDYSCHSHYVSAEVGSSTLRGTVPGTANRVSYSGAPLSRSTNFILPLVSDEPTRDDSWPIVSTTILAPKNRLVVGLDGGYWSRIMGPPPQQGAYYPGWFRFPWVPSNPHLPVNRLLR